MRMPPRHALAFAARSKLHLSMVKSELIAHVAEQKPHLNPMQAEAVVTVILDRISDALVAGDRMELRGFGVFSVKAREARTGRNPKTGEAVPVADRLLPAFKTGKAMQARLNASTAQDPAKTVGRRRKPLTGFLTQS